MSIQWKEFEFSKDGMTIKVVWWAKDFTAYYESEYGQMSYGMHMMYCTPMCYSEEVLRNHYCAGLIPMFQEAVSILKDKSNFFSDFINSYEKLVAELKKEVDSNQAIRKEQKLKFKRGEITQKEYQKFCKEHPKVGGGVSNRVNNYLHQYVTKIAGEKESCVGILYGLLRDKYPELKLM